MKNTVTKNNAIGGYFELETNLGQEYFDDCLRLNTGRNCLRYIIRAYNIKKMYVPAYICPVVTEAIKSEKCDFIEFDIDENFMPTMDFEQNEYILYPNYFGICQNNVKVLTEKYPKVIIDNTHSFFSPKQGLASFNSARKFFGVPDGAYCFCDKKNVYGLETDKSYLRFNHLIQRVDLSAEDGYHSFEMNDDFLIDEPIKYMSKLSHKILDGLDYEKIKIKRRKNFLFLHTLLRDKNQLNIDIDTDCIPFEYPFLCADVSLLEYLFENQIYATHYWDNKKQRKNSFEAFLSSNLVSLPIDQRYGDIEMKKVAMTVFSYIHNI
ncbi:MAG: hypothetical protein PHV37_06985 [Candidatus Gastranaerophilales bacterium]|nr:hypothetical protein [Candidatus Gastranaerophilales bacterium]